MQPEPFIHQIGVDSLYRGPIPIRIPHVFYNISKRQIHICFLHYIVQASMQASEVFLLRRLGQVNTNLIKHMCSLVLRPNAPAKLRFEPSNTSLLITIDIDLSKLWASKLNSSRTNIDNFQWPVISETYPSRNPPPNPPKIFLKSKQQSVPCIRATIKTRTKLHILR